MADNRKPNLLLLNVETGTGSAAERAVLEKAVEATLGRDTEGLMWKVVRLFRNTRPPNNLARYFRVSGHIDAPPQRFDAAGFEYAHRLADASGFKVEPDLPATNYAIPDFPSPTLPRHPTLFSTRSSRLKIPSPART